MRALGNAHTARHRNKKQKLFTRTTIKKHHSQSAHSEKNYNFDEAQKSPTNDVDGRKYEKNLEKKEGGLFYFFLFC